MSKFDEESSRMLFCSRHWDNESYLLPFYNYSVYVLVLLAITATIGNSLILVALQKDTSLHPPSKILLRSLAITDLCVGVISLPLAVTLLLSSVNESWSICRIAKYSVYVVTTISSGVSLATLSAIGVDRLLALLLKLRYRQVVTVKASSCSRLPILAKKHRGRSSLRLEYDCVLPYKWCINSIRSNDINLLLYKNLSHNSASADTST